MRTLTTATKNPRKGKFLMSAVWDIIRSFYCHDALVIVSLVGFSIMGLCIACRFPGLLYFLVQNLLISVCIILIAVADRKKDGTILSAVHRFYVAPMIFIMFKEVYVMLPLVQDKLYDGVLIAIDHAVFGVNPTQWLSHYVSPLSVEYFQLCYSSFYLIMLGLAFEMVVRKQREKYEQTITYLTWGFILSFIGYFLVPAIGPRFTLHDFSQLSNDLPGLWLTDIFRDLINSGESIVKGAGNYLATAQRDAFPSGHTEMTLITIALAWRYKARIRWWATIIGASLVFATVYLRYHYVVDIAGGIAFFCLTMWTAPFIERQWSRIVTYADTAARSL